MCRLALYIKFPGNFQGGNFQGAFDYWNLIDTLTNYNSLAKIALRLISIPPSSAAVERSFSLQAWIHSKNRNRLSQENINKILMVCLMDRNEQSQLVTLSEEDEVGDEDEPVALSEDVDSSSLELPPVIAAGGPSAYDSEEDELSSY